MPTRSPRGSTDGAEACATRGSVRRLSRSATSHHRAELPGHELLVAEAEAFAGGTGTGCHVEHRVVDAPAHLVDRGRTVENVAAVDVHVVAQASVHLTVGGKFQARCGLAPEHRTATRR